MILLITNTQIIFTANTVTVSASCALFIKGINHDIQRLYYHLTGVFSAFSEQDPNIQPSKIFDLLFTQEDLYKPMDESVKPLLMPTRDYIKILNSQSEGIDTLFNVIVKQNNGNKQKAWEAFDIAFQQKILAPTFNQIKKDMVANDHINLSVVDPS